MHHMNKVVFICRATGMDQNYFFARSGSSCFFLFELKKNVSFFKYISISDLIADFFKYFLFSLLYRYLLKLDKVRLHKSA